MSTFLGPAALFLKMLAEDGCSLFGVEDAVHTLW
jgi:hypothetical protein